MDVLENHRMGMQVIKIRPKDTKKAQDTKEKDKSQIAGGTTNSSPGKKQEHHSIAGGIQTKLYLGKKTKKPAKQEEPDWKSGSEEDDGCCTLEGDIQYEEDIELDITKTHDAAYPEEKSSQKEKSRHSPYKTGGSKRAVKKR